MTSAHLIPDAYTEYEDGHLGLVPASLANVEAKIGPASSGQTNTVYTLSGPDAKQQAKTIFKDGPLLRAIEEAFDAGSTRIHAVRIGQSSTASYVARSYTGEETLRISGPDASEAEQHSVNINQTMERIIPMNVLASSSPAQLHFYKDTGEWVQTVSLGEDVENVVGIEPDLLSLREDGLVGCWVLGTLPAPDNTPRLWRVSPQGDVERHDELDLASYLDASESVSGLAAMMQGREDCITVVTTGKLLFFQQGGDGWALRDTWILADLGLSTTDICSACRLVDMKAMMRGESHEEFTVCLDRSARKLYAISNVQESVITLAATVDVSTLMEIGEAEGMSLDPDTMKLRIRLRGNGSNPARVIALTVDWENQVVSQQETLLQDIVGTGLGMTIVEMELRTTLTIQNRSVSPVQFISYEGQGGFFTATQALAQAIDQGGIYRAEVITTPALWLMPTVDEDTNYPDPLRYVAMTGTPSTGEPTNAEVLAGLEATVAKTDTSWIHAVGATSQPLWTAILLHCQAMTETHQAERFAILECPPFSSSHEEGSAQYLSDLQGYVDSLVSRMSLVADKHAVVFAGGARFMSSDGEEYTHSVTASCGGVMAGLDVQKSLINKPVSNLLRLVPEFSPGQIETLIQNRINPVRLKPGRGFIIAHSLTGAAEGSDYSRVNDLRAVFYGAKAAREAAQPYVGEENDRAGEGLRRLESAMARPLEQMRDAGQIDAFELQAVSSESDRLLGMFTYHWGSSHAGRWR